MKFLKVIILSIIILFSGWHPVHAAESKGAQDSLVEVYAGTESNGKFRKLKSCEGFIIYNSSASYILTLKQQTSINSEDSGVIKVVCSEDVTYSTTEVVSSDELNFRILKIDNQINGKGVASLGNSRSVGSSSNCFIIGFDGSNAVTKYGKILQRVSSADNIEYLQSSFDIVSGFNGSPVLDPDEYVIGITDNSIKSNGSGNYMIPIDGIKTILNQFNIPYQSYDYEVNYAKLESLYENCEEILDNGTYTKTSKTALEEQMEVAETQLNGSSYENTVTADTLSIAYDNLLESKNQLEEKMSFVDIVAIAIFLITLIMSIITIHTYFIVRNLRNELSLQGKKKQFSYLLNKKNNVRYELKNNVTSIGRNPEINNIAILENPLLSRKHCQIERKNNQYWIYDCGSRNGTYVNGVSVGHEGRLLKENNEITLVDEAFIFKEMI